MKTMKNSWGYSPANIRVPATTKIATDAGQLCKIQTPFPGGRTA